MRLQLLALLVTVFQLQAAPAFTQQNVDISFRNAELVSVIKEVERQSGQVVVYNSTLLRQFADVTVEQRGVTAVEAINSALKGTGLECRDIDGSLVISRSRTAQNVQPIPLRIEGTVLDHNGEPIAGASIIIKATGAGTTTTANGRFSLTVPGAGSVLQISFIGKKTREITVTGGEALTVRLEEEVAEIDEVVVTGIFNRARESYTGAVTTINKEQIKQYRGQNLIQTLRNIDPAINILENNEWGSDPNRLPEMTIRGRSSLPLDVKALNEGQRNNINTPLIIMDGFEITLQKLMDYNDDEIESINILKDAASTAIYGSRGANGVIVIISKQPAPGRLRINLTAGLDIEMPDLTSYDLLNAAEKLQLEKDNGFYDSKSPSESVRLMEIYNQRYRDVIEGTDTDWISKPVRTGISQRYNLRLEGGSEEFRWGVTTAYNHIEGVMKNSHRNNFSGQISLQYNHKNISIRNQASIVLNKGVVSNYGDFSAYAKMNPYYKPYDENGQFVRNYARGLSSGDPIGNPLYDASLNSFNESKYTEFINNLSIDWTIVEGLILRGQLGLSTKHSYDDIFVSPLHSSFLTGEYAMGDKVLERGSYTYRPGEASSYEAGITLSYARTFAGKHQLYAGLHYTMRENKEGKYEIVGVGYTNESKNSLGNAMSYKPNERPKQYEDIHTRSLGVTANVNYTYDNRYYVDVSFRRDGSSQFGSNNPFGNFWSAGVGWNLHREAFLANSEVIDNLRLKVSYGQTGSQQFSSYEALRSFNYYTDNRYGTWGAAYLSGFGNEDLKWQVTDQFNVGAEIGIYGNRLTAAFDWYIKKKSNLLSEIDIPYYTGFGNYVTNIGEVKNTGFEASLTVVPVRNGDFYWAVTGKIAYNKDKITRLSEDIRRQTAAYLTEGVDVSTLFYEGRSQNALYVVRSLGIDPASGQEFFLNSLGETVYTWSASDKVYAGVAEPTVRGNLSTMLRYKNLSLNLSFAYHWGGVAYNQTLIDRVEIMRWDIPYQNVDRRVLEDRWSKPGDVAAFRKIPGRDETDIRTRATDRFVMDDRVFQMQTASLEYRLDTDWLRRAGIENVRVGVNMSDLFYISSVKRERGLEYPFARRVGVSLSAMF